MGIIFKFSHHLLLIFMKTKIMVLVGFLWCSTFLLAQAPQKEIVHMEPTTAKLIIYGSEDCHYCQDTRNFLTEHHIAFEFYDIDKDPKALQEMLGKLRKAGISTSNLGIPVIDKQGLIFTNSGGFEAFLQQLEH